MDKKEKKVKVKKVKKEKKEKKPKKQKGQVHEVDRKKVKRGLRFKLMLTFVLLIGIPVCIQGLFSYQASRKVLSDNLSELAVQFTRTSSDLIQNYLVGYEESIAQFSDNQSVQIQNIFPQARAQTENAFDAYLKSHKDVMYIYVGTKDTKFLIRPEADLPDGFDPTGRPWYLDAIESGGVIWTEPYQDASSGDLIISTAHVVKNGDSGNVVGVVALDLKLSDLADKLNSVKIGETGSLIVVSEGGTILVHENRDLIGKKIDDEEIGLTDLSNALAADDEETIKYDYNGDNYVTSFTTSPLGWKIVSSLKSSEINSDASSVLVSIIGFGLVALVAAIVISFFFAKTITDNINKLMSGMEQVEKGDLTTTFEIKTHDEIGVLAHYFEETLGVIGAMMRNIQTVVVDVTDSAQNLAASSEEASATSDEIARTVEEIARGASDQAKDTEGAARVAHSLSDKLDTLNSNTDMMITSAKEVMEANEVGVSAIDGLRAKSDEADVANQKIAEVIKELNEKNQHISSILESISAIAVQTNLLALNASIEAARAGEHGRGFAVVAEEIRKLAEESSNSAEQIKEIITNIQSDSEKTVERMDEVSLISKEQATAVQHVDESFVTISNAINSITDKIDLISTSVSELNHDKEDLVQVVSNISAVSEETAASAEEVSASTDQQSTTVDEVARAAERLNEISLTLDAQIRKFKV